MAVMPDYRVQVDVYNGPLDLLLYLIRREEVDIYDIPIARVLEQYCQYVDMLKTIDPNVAGEFLVMAATLMEIKSRMLLPRSEAVEGMEEDLADPRLELVKQLLEYKKFRDASLELGTAARLAAMRWPRGPVRPEAPDPAALDLEDVQIWDLVAAFTRLMASIGAGAAMHDVVFDDTPIALHAADILDRLQRIAGEKASWQGGLQAGEAEALAREGEAAAEPASIAFEEIFAGRSKVEMIGLFLALLELMRQRRVRVAQDGLFGPIRVVLICAEPIEVGEEWMPAIRDAPDGAIGAGTTDAARHQDRPLGDEPVEPSDDDAEVFADLDQIKTDVDIDAILKRSAGPGGGPVQEESQ